MTDDGTFRVITTCTTETVRGALDVQSVTGSAARYFGDLLTGVVLLRETMAPQLRVQGILRGARRTGTVVADSHPTGRTRGLVSRRSKTEDVEIGSGAVLQLMRTLHDGRLHQGLVEVPSNGGISEALMTYMQVSEQVTTVIAVSTVFDDESRVVAAGGYLVQLLPGARRGPIRTMTERLEDFGKLEAELVQPDYCPSRLNGRLLDRMPFTELGESDVRFECWCSQTGVMAALATLPRSEIHSMIADGEVLEISCDYCTHDYRVAPAELHGLLQTS
jgi:molecular chaperone Hsp33